jgi:hypothetical protein
MKRSRSVLFWLTLAVGIPLTCIGVTLISSWLYTTIQLRAAREAGVFSSAEEGMRALIAKSYVEPDRYQIIYAGTNSFDGSSPHVWYVIACVWGGHRVDGSPTGSEKHVYDQPGVFFLDTKEGWVFVPEGAFPELMGFWMQVFDLAGPGSSQPTHDWGSSPQGDCVF